MQDHPQRRLDQSVLHLLHRAGQVADELFAAEMTGSELTPRQYAVLATLARREAASQTDIVRETGIDRSTLADIVKRLVQKGVLSRRRAKNDARAYDVRLTPAGSAILKQAEPAAQRVSDRLLRYIAGTRRADLVDCLSNIVRTLEGKPAKDTPRLQTRA
jgi:MarR family transcriptional regulator, temperature-dependent positive regulator of motility